MGIELSSDKTKILETKENKTNDYIANLKMRLGILDTQITNLPLQLEKIKAERAEVVANLKTISDAGVDTNITPIP